MHTHTPTRGSDRAFSILEMVVVIAVIATLVSLLLPALASSRESARRVVCTSNIRTLCTAVLTYSQANRDCIPVTEWALNRTTGLQSSVLAQPFEALRSELGDPPDWSSFGPARCPSDDRVGPVVGFGYHYVAASWFVWPTTPPAERTKIFNETQGEYRQGEHKLLWMDLDTSAHAGSRRLQDGLYHLGYTDGSVELLSRPGHPFDADYWLNR